MALDEDGGFTVTHTYADEGRYTVTVTAKDDDTTVAKTQTATVSNVAPAVTLKLSTPISEGESARLTGTVFDIETDTLSVVVDWGDGSGKEVITLAEDGTFSILHRYEEAGEYEIRVTAYDGTDEVNVVRTLLVEEKEPEILLPLEDEANSEVTGEKLTPLPEETSPVPPPPAPSSSPPPEDKIPVFSSSQTLPPLPDEAVQTNTVHAHPAADQMTPTIPDYQFLGVAWHHMYGEGWRMMPAVYTFDLPAEAEIECLSLGWDCPNLIQVPVWMSWKKIAQWGRARWGANTLRGQGKQRSGQEPAPETLLIPPGATGQNGAMDSVANGSRQAASENGRFVREDLAWFTDVIVQQPLVSSGPGVAGGVPEDEGRRIREAVPSHREGGAQPQATESFFPDVLDMAGTGEKDWMWDHACEGEIVSNGHSKIQVDLPTYAVVQGASGWIAPWFEGDWQFPEDLEQKEFPLGSWLASENQVAVSDLGWGRRFGETRRLVGGA